jgi:hypothetical protein
MEKIPCEECLVLGICKQKSIKNDSIGELYCDILFDFIFDNESNENVSERLDTVRVFFNLKKINNYRLR